MAEPTIWDENAYRLERVAAVLITVPQARQQLIDNSDLGLLLSQVLGHLDYLRLQGNDSKWFDDVAITAHAYLTVAAFEREGGFSQHTESEGVGQ